MFRTAQPAIALLVLVAFATSVSPRVAPGGAPMPGESREADGCCSSDATDAPGSADDCCSGGCDGCPLPCCGGGTAVAANPPVGVTGPAAASSAARPAPAHPSATDPSEIYHPPRI